MYEYNCKKLKVNIKSLAAESRIIRVEEERTGPEWIRGSLRHHRVDHLRNHTRHSLLAYGYLKGIPYKKMENSCKVPPDINEIRKKLKRHHINHSKLEEWLGVE